MSWHIPNAFPSTKWLHKIPHLIHFTMSEMKRHLSMHRTVDVMLHLCNLKLCVWCPCCFSKLMWVDIQCNFNRKSSQELQIYISVGKMHFHYCVVTISFWECTHNEKGVIYSMNVHNLLNIKGIYCVVTFVVYVW